MAKKRRKLLKSPQQKRSIETVEIVLQASVQILQHQGLEGLSTRNIARRAGVSVGSIYQYFSSRDAILRHLVKSAYEQDIRDFEQLTEIDFDSISEAADHLAEALIRETPDSNSIRKIYYEYIPLVLNAREIAENESRILDALNQYFYVKPKEIMGLQRRLELKMLYASMVGITHHLPNLLDEFGSAKLAKQLSRMILSFLIVDN